MTMYLTGVSFKYLRLIIYHRQLLSMTYVLNNNKYLKSFEDKFLFLTIFFLNCWKMFILEF